MKTLGYILSDRKIRDIEPFVTQIKTLEEAKESLPILIVGWDAAKAHSGYKSVIERSLGNSIYWTFKKTESRVDFEADLKNFYNKIVSSFTETLKYEYVNPHYLTEERIKKMLEYVNSGVCRCIYLSNDMLYIPCKERVIGVSLRVCEYCKKDVEWMISEISKSGKLVTDRNIEDKSVFKWFQNKKYAIALMVCDSC